MKKYKYLLITSFIIIVGVFAFSGSVNAMRYSAIDVIGHFSDTGGGHNSFSNDLGFHYPYGVSLDEVHHHLFVSDMYNHRVLVFNLDSNNKVVDKKADYVLGYDNFNDNKLKSSANSFSQPNGLSYDSINNRLFVADYFYNRVLVFDLSNGITNGMNASYILGQVQGTVGQSTLYNPHDVEYDGVNERLFVSAYNRIMVFDVNPATISNGENASYVLGRADFNTYNPTITSTQSGVNIPVGLAYSESQNYLYVSDCGNNRVLVFDVSASTIHNGENASYVLGQPDFTSKVATVTQNGMGCPSGLAYSESQKYLYVVDGSNNRVLVFDVSSITNGENAIGVLGQSDFVTATATTTQSGLNNPFDVTYDSANNYLYVSDFNNNRVLVFDVSTVNNRENAIDLLGQLNPDGSPIYTTNSVDNIPYNNGFNHPSYVAIDSHGHRMFVSDEDNNRVLVFNLNNDNTFPDYTADYVLGQSDFKTNATDGVTANSMSKPKGVEYDYKNNRLFVADTNNSRVLVFDLSNGITNGMNASYVFGPSNFSSSGYTGGDPTAHNLKHPSDIEYDSKGEMLFVSDSGYDRVLVFDVNPLTISTGENAMYVLGQNDFISMVDGQLHWDKKNNKYITTRYWLTFPEGLAYDNENRYLYVADSRDNRVVVYDVNTLTIQNGEDALYVLGRPDFISTGTTYHPSLDWVSGKTPPPPSARTMYMPSDVELVTKNTNKKYLYVSDHGNNRVLVYDVRRINNGESAVGVLGQTDFISNDPSTTKYDMDFPTGLAYDKSSDRIYVVDTYNNRILAYNPIHITIKLRLGYLINKIYHSQFLLKIRKISCYAFRGVFHLHWECDGIPLKEHQPNMNYPSMNHQMPEVF